MNIFCWFPLPKNTKRVYAVLKGRIFDERTRRNEVGVWLSRVYEASKSGKKSITLLQYLIISVLCE